MAFARGSICACVRSAMPGDWRCRSARWSSTTRAKAATGNATPGSRRVRWPAIAVPASSCRKCCGRFVYRKYLDYTAFAGLREMKALIDAEVARKDLADNLKLGPGGIREIEFIVQLTQLIRGGREPSLRVRGLLPALTACEARGHIPRRARACCVRPMYCCARWKTACRCCAMRRPTTCPTTR
jgi:hypothetical protein